jgi:hypothetical protein
MSAVAVLLLWTLSGRWAEQRARQVTSLAAVRDIAALNAIQPKVLIAHASALRWEFVWRPFAQSPLRVPFVALGASAQTPPVRSALRSYGLDNVLPSACQDPDVLLVADAWIVPAFAIFMEEHHRRPVVFQPRVVGETLTAWECR